MYNEIDGAKILNGKKQLLQSKIEKLSDDQLDHLFDFLGYHDTDCEVSIDLDLMEGAQQRVLAKFVDGLCCATIANLQAKCIHSRGIMRPHIQCAFDTGQAFLRQFSHTVQYDWRHCVTC